MDRIDRHDAALSHRAERGHDDVARGRERHGAIERTGRSRGRFADPIGAQGPREGAMPLAARRDVGLAPPCAQDG
jgi:hypothetical protein